MTDPLIQDTPETEEAQAATKAAVFNAAERLFALHGFQNVSVRDITAEAGVNLASVNYHFGSKDALLFEIFRRRTSELNRERARMLHEAGARHGGKPPVREILEAYFAPPLRWASPCLAGALPSNRLPARPSCSRAFTGDRCASAIAAWSRAKRACIRAATVTTMAHPTRWKATATTSIWPGAR